MILETGVAVICSTSAPVPRPARDVKSAVPQVAVVHHHHAVVAAVVPAVAVLRNVMTAINIYYHLRTIYRYGIYVLDCNKVRVFYENEHGNIQKSTYLRTLALMASYLLFWGLRGMGAHIYLYRYRWTRHRAMHSNNPHTHQQ